MGARTHPRNNSLGAEVTHVVKSSVGLLYLPALDAVWMTSQYTLISLIINLRWQLNSLMFLYSSFCHPSIVWLIYKVNEQIFNVRKIIKKTTKKQVIPLAELHEIYLSIALQGNFNFMRHFVVVVTWNFEISVMSRYLPAVHFRKFSLNEKTSADLLLIIFLMENKVFPR